MGIFNKLLNKEFSQEQLKDYFYYKMSSEEIEKIEQLDVANILTKIQTGTIQFKYIKDVGFILIGEGYVIMSDGQESPRYFQHFFTTSPIKAKKELVKFYNK